MTKLTQKALERKIIRGELEVEYEPTRCGFVGVRSCITGKHFTIQLVG